MLKAALRDGRDIADTPLDPAGGETLSNVQVIVTNRRIDLIEKRTVVAFSAVERVRGGAQINRCHALASRNE